MDGKGRYLAFSENCFAMPYRATDTILIERLWRSLEYKYVYLYAWESGPQARKGVGRWVEFYNYHCPHKALGGRPPAVVYSMRNELMQPNKQEQRLAWKASDPVERMASTS